MTIWTSLQPWHDDGKLQAVFLFKSLRHLPLQSDGLNRLSLAFDEPDLTQRSASSLCLVSVLRVVNCRMSRSHIAAHTSKKSSEHKQKSTRDMRANHPLITLNFSLQKSSTQAAAWAEEKKKFIDPHFCVFRAFFFHSLRSAIASLSSWLCSELLSEESLNIRFFFLHFSSLLSTEKLQQREKRNEMVNKNWKFFYLFSSPSCLHAHDPARIFFLCFLRSTLSPHLYSIPSDRCEDDDGN